MPPVPPVPSPASPADPQLLRRLAAHYDYGIYLGTSGGMPAFAPAEHGVLALGPPRVGKTSSVIVPNVLQAGGPTVVASTKADVLEITAPARLATGEPCALFDLSGRIQPPPGVATIAWSPLRASLAWDGAVLVADSMVRAARPGSQTGDASHWSERAGALLSTLFHAAALSRTKFDDLISAVDSRQSTVLLATLAEASAQIPLDLLNGILATDPREQSGIWSTASSVLAAYRTKHVRSTATGTELDAAAFVRSGGTLYICAGTDIQRQAAPVVAGLLREIRSAAYAAAASGELGHVNGRPPCLFVLDELANIAPLHDLSTIVSEGGSQGVVTLACLQDLSQAVARWGPEGAGFLTLFNTKLIFPGIGDRPTLEAVSSFAGDHPVRTDAYSPGQRLPGLPGLLGRRGPDHHTYSTRLERRLPIDAIAQGAAGKVVCIDGATPSLVGVTPWFQTSPFREVVAGAPSLAATRDEGNEVARTDERDAERFADRQRSRGIER